jgi:hypothetical protein
MLKLVLLCKLVKLYLWIPYWKSSSAEQLLDNGHSMGITGNIKKVLHTSKNGPYPHMLDLAHLVKPQKEIKKQPAYSRLQQNF